MGHAAKSTLQKSLDFLDTFMVNNCMREYENFSRWHPPVLIPILDCTVTCAAAPAFPPKIDCNFNLAHARNPSENTDILIALLIANGNHSQKSINTLNSEGYKFLIASISYEIEGVKYVGVLASVNAELLEIDPVNRRDVGISRGGRRKIKHSKSKTPGAKCWRLGHPHPSPPEL
jgi:hypothetical protein